jgi:hypothetical protein
MSKSAERANDIFTECKKNTEKFFNEIGKSTPIYHQTATDIQKSYFEAWKNVINSSIALQQEFAIQSGLNVSMNEETIRAMHNITEQAITAFQNQNKFAQDSSETSKKIFDAFNENTKTFASLNKNMLELMVSAIQKNTQK